MQLGRADFLSFPRDILPIRARTVVIERSPESHPSRALLLVGEKKHEAAFRLRQRLGHRARVLMGSVQALQLAHGQPPVAASLSPSRRDLGEVATPSASRDCSAVLAASIAEQAPAEPTPAAPKLIAHATPFTDRYPWEDTPAAVSSAPSSGYASAHISRILLPEDVTCLSSQALDPELLFSSETSPALLPSLIKSLVLPAGLPLRLKALTLAGKIAESLAGQIPEAFK